MSTLPSSWPPCMLFFASSASMAASYSTYANPRDSPTCGVSHDRLQAQVLLCAFDDTKIEGTNNLHPVLQAGHSEVTRSSSRDCRRTQDAV